MAVTDMNSIRIVVDNEAAEGFVAEHGFSLWIDMGEHRVLFDTGNSGALLPNLDKLGLDPAALTHLVISHGHYDHTGGVQAVVESAPDLQIYLHQAALQPRYSIKEDETKPIRMPAGSMQALQQVPDSSIHWLTHPISISKDLGLTGPISRQTDYEDSGGPFFYDPLGTRPDPIEDDNALWIRTTRGLIICVGCSHSGIVNTIRTILEITGERAIHAIIGGLHLLNASTERLDHTVWALNDFSIGKLIACHCTGDEAYSYLQTHLNCQTIQGYAGMSISF